MSATTGTRTARTIFSQARTLSMSGTLTRAMSTPASSMRLISSTVRWTSVVGVVAMDWMDMGAPPPTGTAPTMTWRVGRYGP